MGIKLLKLALSSYNGPYSKHEGHVSNLEKCSPYKRPELGVNYLFLL
jgi:hypothetical protein